VGALGILSARDIQKKKLLAVLTAIGGAAVLATVATAAGKIGDLGRSNGLVSGYITGASVQVGLLVAGLGGIAIITGTVVVGLNSDK
jgi:Zn-dependent protease